MRHRWFVILACVACGGPASGPAALDEPGPLDFVGEAVHLRYLTEFALVVPRPAIVNDTLTHTCPGRGYLTTVAYLPGALPTEREMRVMHMTRDGGELTPSNEGITTQSRTIRIPPAGRFKVLTVVLTWPSTMTEAELPLLVAAQAEINQQHAAFAASRGYATPIVQFEFTNLTLSGALAPTPRSRDAMRALVAVAGTNPDAYDFLAVLNMDPNTKEGGFASVGTFSPAFLYMGNYGTFTSTLDAEAVQSVASSAYHHEVGHHWGWSHGWTPNCSGPRPFKPFITSPMLFGWEDTDGDRIPEILDSTPYGRFP